MWVASRGPIGPLTTHPSIGHVTVMPPPRELTSLGPVATPSPLLEGPHPPYHSLPPCFAAVARRWGRYFNLEMW